MPDLALCGGRCPFLGFYDGTGNQENALITPNATGLMFYLLIRAVKGEPSGRSNRASPVSSASSFHPIYER